MKIIKTRDRDTHTMEESRQKETEINETHMQNKVEREKERDTEEEKKSERDTCMHTHME